MEHLDHDLEIDSDYFVPFDRYVPNDEYSDVVSTLLPPMWRIKQDYCVQGIVAK